MRISESILDSWALKGPERRPSINKKTRTIDMICILPTGVEINDLCVHAIIGLCYFISDLRRISRHIPDLLIERLQMPVHLRINLIIQIPVNLNIMRIRNIPVALAGHGSHG